MRPIVLETSHAQGSEPLFFDFFDPPFLFSNHTDTPFLFYLLLTFVFYLHPTFQPPSSLSLDLPLAPLLPTTRYIHTL